MEYPDYNQSLRSPGDNLVVDKTSEVGDYAEQALHLLDHYCIHVLSVIIKLNSRFLAGIWTVGELAGVRKKKKKHIWCQKSFVRKGN